MKYFFFVALLIYSNLIHTREIGQTEITADEGIEVFQKEKFYLLKENVKIVSDNFTLYGDTVKIYFEKDLYDVIKIDAWGNVKLNSEAYNIKGNGNYLTFHVNTEDLLIEGLNSKLITKDMEMFSDGKIKVNNLTGKFNLNGPNSRLNAEEININAEDINGLTSNQTGINEILELSVFDKNLAYIKSENTDMYANNAVYDKGTSIIELESNVKIIRDGETVTGDYGTLNTENQSYKVKSKNSKKVKVVLSNQDE